MLLAGGRHGTGLAEAQAAAKAPRGSFFYCFASKEAFGAEVVEHSLALLLRRLGDYLAEPGRNGLEALGANFRELARELGANDFRGGCLLGDLMGEIGDSSPAARRLHRRDAGPPLPRPRRRAAALIGCWSGTRLIPAMKRGKTFAPSRRRQAGS